jgi:hypothetical protein
LPHVVLAAKARYPCHDSTQGFTKDGFAAREIKALKARPSEAVARKGLAMTTFDEREHGYEAKFARDEELRFKAKARRDKALGAWVAAQLGLTGEAAADYARGVLAEDFKHPGDAELIARLLAGFEAKGVAMDERTLKKKLVELMAHAVAEIEGGK